MSRTYELNIYCEDKPALKLMLDAAGYDDYVDASFDALDLSDQGSEAVIDTMLEREGSLPLTLYFESLEGRQECERCLADGELALRLERRDFDSKIWQTAWEEKEENFETDHFVVMVDDAPPTATAKHILKIRSQGAFGSGQHATTKAILRLMETERPSSPSACLDVGTGTGILAIAAEKLGYTQVVATDIEETAIASAQGNRSLNHASFSLILGSLPEGQQQFDLIVSNILPPVINNMLDDFFRRLKPGGRVILAGFNEANAATVHQDAQDAGFAFATQVSERGWLASAFDKPILRLGLY
ncbi:50S ribosomal protein L11 methyltransferase [Pseudobacteriovorax antillogorgiicola]|uniref:Ribosomal protein L11 methylase PrmA n=1 Tax=Pseudobacteriovorax antillogorgiicola TaxID=1513793 RepID=A0A1Y6BQ99_9BACT|nr:50S ribosomal protein L11 methyltransferase [Pseudobacteriovorax antillogorgiicola]TCS55406.1 ribosomal protein L11 methylase PrmA [Pseudobacteriovorax antillogorgiicola]SMF12857.1 Ribosomal protein L11 methylase PrmA [Pseudobacteriovorax antillogorgiicola]